MTNSAKLMELVSQMEELHREKHNVPLVFAEIFKDEINSNDEQRLFNGIKRVIKKYGQDSKTVAAINEFTSVISGGASLDEIMQISLDEVENPTPATQLMVDT